MWQGHRLGQGGETDMVAQMMRQATARTAAETGRPPFEVVLESVRDRLTALLVPAQLENPGPAEREAMRRVASEEIARYDEAAPVHGLATLDENERAPRGKSAALSQTTRLLTDEGWGFRSATLQLGLRPGDRCQP